MLEESKLLFLEVDDTWGYAHAFSLIALGRFIQNDNEISLLLHEQSLALFSDIGDRLFEAVMLRAIGILKARLGDTAGAVESLHKALTLLRQLDNTYFIRYVLWGLAEAAKIEGDVSRSVCLYWAGRNVAHSIGAWRRLDEPVLEKALAQCRAALSESGFAEAVEKGRAITMEQAVAYALEDQE